VFEIHIDNRDFFIKINIDDMDYVSNEDFTMIIP